MLKRLIFTFCLLPSIASHGSEATPYGVHEQHPYHLSITKDIYTTAEFYQIKSPQRETYHGTVKKSLFRIRTNYDLSNKAGWQATGITRALSFGALYPWATDIDVYDTRAVQIGMIDGSIATLEAAKFNLYEYDEQGNAAEIGIAYASSDFNRFVILTDENSTHPIAELNRNYVDRRWDIDVHDPEKIDDRMIRIFAAFVIDYQNKFIAFDDQIAN